jgi:hypothetical protein
VGAEMERRSAVRPEMAGSSVLAGSAVAGCTFAVLAMGSAEELAVAPTCDLKSPRGLVETQTAEYVRFGGRLGPLAIEASAFAPAGPAHHHIEGLASRASLQAGPCSGISNYSGPHMWQSLVLNGADA